ncbi:MAG: hypothetical protein J6K45_00090 [Clostridia bacterium]|nr:hypothetical protein [Clostridia bacterium]
MIKKTETEKINFRYNLLNTFIYIFGIILLVQLFNLQIIHGKEYRETSNTKLTKEAIVEAARGKILDRTGTILAETEMGFNVELFKTKATEEEMNNAMLVLAEILEKNGDKYIDDFPITIDPFEYHFPSEEELNEWREEFDISSKASPEEAFYVMKDYYGITETDVAKARKIVGLRYTIEEKGYSATSALEVASNVSRNSALEIDERGEELPGISIEIKSNRVYTQGSLASHVLGYIGRISEDEYNKNPDRYQKDDYIGKTGIEYLFEEYLKGENGTKQIDMTVDGTSTGEYITKEAIGGSNVVLTIDANLQLITENALKNNIEKIKNGGFGEAYNALGGSVVVMNVKTGEVLAMVSYPDYEPSEFLNGISQAKLDEYNNNSALLNRAIQGTYAPGSIFKMVTSIAGLQEGVITTTETINDTGIYPKGSNPHCWIYDRYHYGHGRINVSQALQKSCNYYFYETGSRLGLEKLSAYANYFGLGRRTGIELPYEAKGTLASPETAQRMNDTAPESTLLSAAIGQSYNDFSPIQVAKYISMIANRGQVVNPTIIKNVVDSDGKQVSKTELENYVQEKLGLDPKDTDSLQISDENMNAVLEGMRGVTDDNGTAAAVFDGFSIAVGGKTGSTESGTYDSNGTEIVNAWFVGFAPFDNPEIAVVGMVENGWHGSYVAEVVRDIISEYFGMNVEEINEDVNASLEVEFVR